MSYGYPGYPGGGAPQQNQHHHNQAQPNGYPGYPGANATSYPNQSFAGGNAPNNSFAAPNTSFAAPNSYPYGGGSQTLNGSVNGLNSTGGYAAGSLNGTQYNNQYPTGTSPARPLQQQQQQSPNQQQYPGVATVMQQQQQPQQQPRALPLAATNNSVVTTPGAPVAAAHQYPRADAAYAQQNNGQSTSFSSPLAPMSSYFASSVVAKLPTIHTSDSTADPDKPLDVYAYLLAKGFKNEQVLAARHEHVDPEPDMCLTDVELRDYGGNSIFCYFKYSKFLAVLVFIFFCLSVINYAIFAGQEKPAFSNSANQIWYADFFISEYTTSQRNAWLGTSIVCFILMFFASPCYYRYIGGYTFEDDNRSLGQIEEDAVTAGNVEDAITRFNDDGSIDVSARYRTYTNVFFRRIASLFVFAAFIAIQVGASIGITRIESASRGAGPAFAIAIIAAVLNMIYQFMARQLTDFERWTEIGSSDKSLTLKLIFFKLANVIAVYGSKDYPSDRCVYEIVGEQFMTLLLVEIFFTTPSTMITAALSSHYHQYIAHLVGSINGDARNKAQFEMAVEYLQSIYKFYLCCMALVVFPLSTVLSIVALFVNFWGARYRMIKICSKPIRSSATMKGTVTIVMVLIFFAALFTPFAGSVWIMAGWSSKRTSTARFCALNG